MPAFSRPLADCPDAALAAVAGVLTDIDAMFLLRCLHPPGGASALLAVLVHTHDPRFALLPILLNSVLLVIVGMAYNTLTGRRYPHVQTTPAAPLSPAGARFSSADLDAALVHYNQVLDVSRDDLEELLHHAEAAAYRRNLGELRCQDVMSRDPLTVSIDTPIATAWSLMRAREVKALPVVDKSHRIVGIVTLADGTVLPTDLVVLSVGVKPRTELAESAGLELTDSGAIVVDDAQRTSDPFIWAVGDATASVHAVTGAVGPVALATPANRGGRVAADSIVASWAGLSDRHRRSPRPLGTAIVRVFDLVVGMTGASRRALGDLAFHTARTHSGHHAGYYPGAEAMHLVLHFAPDGRILGAQGAGRAGIDKRIDVIATAARGGLHADDLVDLDLSYAPPFGAAKDPVLMLGMIADNVLRAELTQHDPVVAIDPELQFVLDVRNPGEWARGHIVGATLVPQPEVAASLDRIRELAGERPIVVHCASGFRSYLAHRTLAAAGMPSANVSGGFTSLAVLQPNLVTTD